MDFQTTPYEDSNFQKFGWTTGGSTTSKIEGRERTQEELLNHAASLPQPNSNLTKHSVKIRLKELRQRYHNDNWHQHLTVTETEGKTNETFQNTPPGD